MVFIPVRIICGKHTVDTICDTIYNQGAKIMSKWEKLIKSIIDLSADLRFEELKKILEHYGYKMKAPSNGSSHCTFRKDGKMPVTIPKKNRLKGYM